MRNISLLVLLFFSVSFLAAQEGKKDMGILTGGFETNNQLYKKDSATNAVVPPDKFGSNSFLKLDYQYRNFSAGVQFESYLPLLVGYPGNANLDGSKLINKYFTYRNEKLQVTVGDFYEQFGSGLIFRSFENRQIGINNAVQGVNVRFQPASFLDVKVIYGKQRRYFDFSDGVLRGGDVEMNWTGLSAKPAKNKFTTGFSVVSRYDPYFGPNPTIKATVDAWSARADFSSDNFYINAETVNKSTDAHVVNNFYTMKGKSLLVNTGFTAPNLGVNLTLRRLENMDFRTDREAIQGEYLVNYIPALTKQHDYSLANIYVYNPQAIAEIGGQFDLVYNFKKGSAIGGKYGANLTINYAQYNNLDITNFRTDGFDSKFLSLGKQKYFSDLSVEFHKKWNAKTTTNFLYHNLYYNKSVIEGGLFDTVKAHILIADVLMKLAPKKSIRFEAQHLFADKDFRNWAAGLVELGFAPRWTFYVQDLYNYGNTKKKVHYYSFGTGFTYKTTRLLLNYGRQRAGLLCVGGVCRMVPAATGLSVSMTTSF